MEHEGEKEKKMAKEYIDREAALIAIKVYCPANYEAEMLARIVRIPAADVVEVVRCFECVYHDTADYGGGYTKNVCRLFSRQIQNDDYCSYGMRKDGDGE